MRNLAAQRASTVALGSVNVAAVKILGSQLIRKPPVRAVCFELAAGLRALAYVMRFICFTYRDLRRRKGQPSSALVGRGQGPDR